MEEGFDFGEALKRLRDGKKVYREGWNGRGMYLRLIQGYPVNQYYMPVGDEVVAGQMLPFIIMKTAGDSKTWGEGKSDFVAWLASQTDILATDWFEFEE